MKSFQNIFATAVLAGLIASSSAHALVITISGLTEEPQRLPPLQDQPPLMPGDTVSPISYRNLMPDDQSFRISFTVSRHNNGTSGDLLLENLEWVALTNINNAVSISLAESYGLAESAGDDGVARHSFSGEATFEPFVVPPGEEQPSRLARVEKSSMHEGVRLEDISTGFVRPVGGGSPTLPLVGEPGKTKEDIQYATPWEINTSVYRLNLAGGPGTTLLLNGEDRWTIPEPSAFFLLSISGALLLVVSRSRRAGPKGSFALRQRAAITGRSVAIPDRPAA